MAKKQVVRQMAKRSRSGARNAGFGAVSTINTAPVSVGNSVRGSQPRVSQTTDGARVVGRDFAFALSGTAAAVTNWELIGGMPVTPACLPSSILRNYTQMFNKFKVNRLTVHYITSSPTSQAGDVLFYFEKDRFAPMCDYSNSSFLPYVLSDPHTVIGPQWTNHSITLKPAKDWKTTLYGQQTDLNEDSEGTIFFFSKTNAANSPGYLLIDYDIQFKELSVNPRAGTLPVARAQSTFVSFRFNGASVVNTVRQFGLAGNNVAGQVSTAPNGSINGDIYKIILQVTASQLVNPAWSGTVTPTAANLLQYGSSNRTLSIDDGTTFYAMRDATSGLWVFYATMEGAVTSTDAIESQTTSAVNDGYLCAEMQLVRNITDFTQSSY